MKLLDFLNARLDEDEQIARAALQATSKWHAIGHNSVNLGEPDFTIVDVFANGLSIEAAAPADHVIHWQPARVLAEVAAKRKILELHPIVTVMPTVMRPASLSCLSCDDEWGADGICDTVLAVAQVYADHPDFDPAWAEQ